MVTATKTLGKTLSRVTTIDGGYTRSVEVNVVAEGTGNTPPPIQAVGGITIPSRFYLEEEGQPHIIPVTVTPANAANKDLVWTISNPRITVDANGMISGSGTAAITATTVDGGKTSNKCFVITSPENVLIKGHSLGDFYMGRFDVWQEKWRTVMTGNTNNISATPSYFSSSPVGVEDQELRVVENVSWYEVLVFCNRLSVQEGLTPAYEMQASTGTTRTSDTSQWGIVPGGLDVRWNGVSIVAGSTGYRLPTLSQWAYAARGGASTYYWWGNDFDRNGGYVVWGTTHQVGMALPNPWGLFDMWGNVWKLLWDPISNNRRAARGAAYDSGNEGFREDFDGGAQPHQRDRTIGFRVMRPGTTQLEEVLIPASNGNVIIQDQFVSLSAFYMSAYQITQSLYQEVMGTNPSYFHGGSGREPVAGEAQGYRPVENVSWYNALVFCNRLSERDGLTPAYEMIPSTGGTTMTSNTTQWGNVPGISDARWNAVSIVAGSTGYRLPTENQWEYACRGGVTGVIYSFYYKTGGTGAAAGTNTWSNDFGWTSENAGNRTHQVGLKWPNGYGLYDMHGNVWEWVYDWLPGGYGTFRMMRGGTYTGSSGYTASTSRSSHNPHDRFNDLGLRLVRP
jgi:formylglycine-generating enzyme required for sulfatase activity